MKKILSIDGGGIRGVLPATILAHIEKRAAQIAGEPNLRIATLFHLLAGTSAGGILVALYLTPKERGVDNSPKYSAEEVRELFSQLGPIVFNNSLRYSLRSMGGILRSRYNEELLHSFAKEHIGDSYISEVMKDCLITAYDLSSRKALLFSRFATERYGETANYKLSDIACATSSAPSYFAPAQIFAKDGGSRHLIDGGVYASNPAMCAIVEAIKIWPKEPISNLSMLSLGTGKSIKPYHYHRTKRYGYINWLQPILDVLTSSVSETVDYQAGELFSLNGVAKQYIRIEPPLLDASSRIDNASKSNMRSLESAAQNYIDHHGAHLEAIAQSLIDN